MPDGISSLSKPLVLVVEDEAALATMLRYNLEKQGYRVEEAADGQEALTRIAETQPDLVLLDWMLPQMSGLEVCRQIRRRSATRDLPVIMVTARTEDQDAVLGRSERAQTLHRFGVQRVSRGADGADDVKLAVGVDRLAQTPDMYIDRTRLDMDVGTPHSVQQLLA